jgi:hypothetical protein
MEFLADGNCADARLLIVVRSQVIGIGDNLRLKPIVNVAFRRSLDPPKSPLRRGTLSSSSPPLLKGG